MKKRINKIDKIIIKPTLLCNQNCKTCSSRSGLHKELTKRRTLSLAEWKQVFVDADALGNKFLSISGGEPTIYKNLIDLIESGRWYGWFVSMNTNGTLITEEYATRLLEAGLDQVRISLYSHAPGAHKKMRGRESFWEKTVNAVRIFRNLRKKYPEFRLVTQTLISRDNYMHLPEILELHYELGSCYVHFSYLEGDFEKKNLLNEEEIIELKADVIPRAINFAETLRKPFRKMAVKVLRNLYSTRIAEISDFAEGVYNPKGRTISPCSIPSSLALILANGDVHPCNVVEYSHEPVVGNLFKNRLNEIWNGEKWNTFRNEYFSNRSVDYCRLCPMNLHCGFHLRRVGTLVSSVKRRTIAFHHSVRRARKRPLLAAQ